MENIEHLLNTYSLYMLAFGTTALIILAVIALKVKKLSIDNKKLLFLAIVLVTFIPTIVMSASTIYLNVISSSGGPVHWHADFEVWACGKEINLKDPKGLSNKIGTSTLHEHNDKRIHVEGVVLSSSDVNLGNFFHSFGGSLLSDSYSVPTNEGLVSVKNGDSCNGVAGKVQMFIYMMIDENKFTQFRVQNPKDYILSPFSQVPQGDCIIVEFDAPKKRTDKICRSYKVAEEIGKVKGEDNGN